MHYSLVAALQSVLLGLRFFGFIGIRTKELPRFFLKCLNLGLCYGGFVESLGYKGARKAGRAAFLCCVYDVASDWRGFDSDTVRAFEHLLGLLVPRWAEIKAVELFRVEREKRLSADGLERGFVALEFVTGVIGSYPHFAKHGIRELGMLLQIIDDVLDYEEDVARCEKNCLVGDNRAHYLDYLIRRGDHLRQLFKRNIVMSAVIRISQKKASALLKSTPGSSRRLVLSLSTGSLEPPQFH